MISWCTKMKMSHFIAWLPSLPPEPTTQPQGICCSWLLTSFRSLPTKTRSTQECQSVVQKKKKKSAEPSSLGQTTVQSQLNHSCDTGECPLARLKETWGATVSVCPSGCPLSVQYQLSRVGRWAHVVLHQYVVWACEAVSVRLQKGILSSQFRNFNLVVLVG